MTKRRGIQLICGLLTLALACCAPKGERASLRAVIAFVNADKTPAVNAQVYVIENVGYSFVVTDVLTTDEQGRVFLEGAYCLPAFIRARGGQVVIDRFNLAPSYEVTIKDGDQRPLDHFAGKPDSKYLGYPRAHTDCD